MKINSIKYVFENKQPELRRIVVKYGLPPAYNSQDLWKKVNYLVAKFKNEMLRDIAEIHPDKELILWNESLKGSEKPNLPEIPLKSIMQSPQEQNETALITTSRSNVKNKTYSSVCGCSSADGESCADNCSNAVDGDSNCNGTNCSCNCKKDTKSNSNGIEYQNANGSEYYNASGTNTLKEHLPILVIGGLVAIGVFLMIKDAPSV